MKKVIIIMLCLFALGATANAQKYYSQPANDTVAADTNYLPSSTGYDMRNIESGAFSYTFTHTDVADSLSYARIEYSNNRVTWTAYTGNAALTNTSTDGQSKIYITTPMIDRYIRVAIACASGDSVAITGQVLMLKND